MIEPHLLTADEGHQLVFGAMVTDTNNVLQVGAASSRDGLEWTCSPNEPIFGPEHFPLAPGLHSFVAFNDGAGTTMLVEILGDERSDLWLARAALTCHVDGLPNVDKQGWTEGSTMGLWGFAESSNCSQRWRASSFQASRLEAMWAGHTFRLPQNPRD